MCRFIKDLIEKNHVTPKEQSDLYATCFRQFAPFQINEDVYISIQASGAHRCTPQRTTHDLESYSHWEFAFIIDERFVRATDVFPEFASLAELELYFQGSAYLYVPKDLVEELYLALN